MRGRKRKSGYRRREGVQLGVGQVGDPDRAPGGPSLSSPAATTSFISRSTSLRWEPARQRQVQGDPFDHDARRR